MVETKEARVVKYFIATKSSPKVSLLSICKTSSRPEPEICPADK